MNVADGTAEAARRLERELWNDPASCAMPMRGEIAVECAEEKG